MPRLLALMSLLLVISGLLCPEAGANPPRVAVLELQGKAEADLMALLSDKVRSGVLEATRGQDIVVMSRENMAVLAKDMGLDLSCIEGACEVETGRNIGAKYVVSGSVTEVGGLWLCTLKVHETQKGALLATGEAEAASVLALRKAIPPEMTRLMVVALGGLPAEDIPPVVVGEPSAVETVTGGSTDIAALAARAAQAQAAREQREAALAAEQARLDAERMRMEEEERKAKAALEAAQRERLARAAEALKTEASREYAALKPLIQMGVSAETRPVLQAFVKKYSGAKVRVDALELAVEVPSLARVQRALGSGVGAAGETLSGGYAHTCGVLTSGAVKCWGDNSFGQSRASSGTFKSVSSGTDHTCGVLTSGAVRCWGSNSDGQSRPPSGTFTSVSASGETTCGVLTSGAVKCWGNNSYGQSRAPSGRFKSVSTAYDHTCGVLTSGAVKCWGDNKEGEARVPSGRFSSVSAGSNFTCGVLTSGAVKCWGSDSYGQSSPPRGRFSSVSAGGLHTCGLLTSGAVKCWGSNGEGRATVPSGMFRAVNVGDTHTCGLLTSGAVKCWGSNEDTLGLRAAGKTTPPRGIRIATD